MAAPTLERIADLAAGLAEVAGAANHRRLLRVAGDRGWCQWAAEVAVEALGGDALWVGDQAPGGVAAVSPGAARRWLGREVAAAVFDAHPGLDPDAFGTIAGTIRGGGLLLLLTPPLAEWESPAQTGRLLRRLTGLLAAAEGVTTLEQERPCPVVPPPRTGPVPPPAVEPPFSTEDQAAAVDAVERVATGHRRRPAVLVSDRGRGKSAALGIAAARLLDDGLDRIVVTAPRLEAVRPLFDHAHRLLPGAEGGPGSLHFRDARLQFLPPDAVVRERPDADLLLVDEAAGIPAPLLEAMLRRHARIAFATTVHGYEGTGRGFAVRFRDTLDRVTPDWRELRLERPVRWAAGDPLERLVFRALLLDAEPAPAGAVAGATTASCKVEALDRDALVADDRTLGELFGLLVLAHYRTRPRDLADLLDAPDLTVWTLRHGGHVAATALVAPEGGLDAGLAREVYLGRRRARGHLIPQSLALHAGVEAAPGLRGDRVMRIAVHPAARRRGLGARLLAEVATAAREAGRDWVGASFGATVDLLRFWEAAGMRPVRLGVTREASSGCHSAICLRPLTPAGKEVHAAARHRFLSGLPLLLSDPLRELEPGLAGHLLRAVEDAPAAAVEEPGDRADVETFAFGSRPYETCLPAVWRRVAVSLTDPEAAAVLTPLQRDVLVLKVLQKRGWAETAAATGLAGRAAVEAALRSAVAALSTNPL